MYKQVVVHEFGHSFAGLADEYAYEQEQIPMYPHDVEPWEKNITTLVDFHDKWEKLIAPTTSIPTPVDFYGKKNKKKGTPIPTPIATAAEQPNEKKGKKSKTPTYNIGVYESAGYSLKGVYRATPDCRMRSNDVKEFCPACQKALRELINFYTE